MKQTYDAASLPPEVGCLSQGGPRVEVEILLLCTRLCARVHTHTNLIRLKFVTVGQSKATDMLMKPLVWCSAIVHNIRNV